MGKRILSIIGTRPEAIKMAPVIRAIVDRPELTGIVCTTGQHREMLQQVLETFCITPDYELNVMRSGHTLNSLTSRIFGQMDGIFENARPDIVLVQGDTTTAMCVSIAAFHRGIKVGHVEAGLRTYDFSRPFPEELNRRAIDLVSAYLFAPTVSASNNLERECFPSDRIVVTGNTVIDALLATVELIKKDVALQQALAAKFARIETSRPLILVTGHRRESFGIGIEQICDALKRLAMHHAVEIIYPVHLNPNVDAVVRKRLMKVANVHLLEPLDYVSFVYMMHKARIIVTDSGGVQEEAAALGKRVIVMREVTERPEGVEAGLAELTGTDPSRICDAVAKALAGHESEEELLRLGRELYGDGQAGRRIAAQLCD
jgi:UDP-N-acetylglucosamine 2-epimerase (non-hydrolysing)